MASSSIQIRHGRDRLDVSLCIRIGFRRLNDYKMQDLCTSESPITAVNLVVIAMMAFMRCYLIYPGAYRRMPLALVPPAFEAQIIEAEDGERL